jgi:pyruvate-formate lyase
VREDHPLRPIRTMVDEILKQLSPQFNNDVRESGAPGDSTRAVVARTAVAAVLFGTQRATPDGRDGLQHFVPLVCGAEFG